MSTRQVTLRLAALAIALGALLLLADAVPAPLAEAAAHRDSVPGDFRLARLAGRDDPAQWSEDAASGLRFRRAVADEREANGWPEGTFLVEAPDLAAAALGAPEIALLLPREDDRALLLPLRHARAQTGGDFLETAVDGETRALTPTFHHYAGAAGDATRVRLVSSLEGGHALIGVDGDAALDGWGHQASWTLAELPGAPPRERLMRITLAAASAASSVSPGECGGSQAAVCAPAVTPNGSTVDVCDTLMAAPGGDGCDRVRWRCANDDLACRTLCQQTIVLQVRLHPCEPLVGFCQQSRVIVTVETCGRVDCQDGMDNDSDGRVDYPADPDCTSPTDGSEEGNTPAAACSDRRDNDGDGRTDFPDDPGCADVLDSNEGDDPACWDRVDNDGDRWTDFPSDPGCTSERDTSEADTRTTYRFALMGEIQWCTAVGSNWPSRLVVIGDAIEAAFDANGATRANPFHSFSHCWSASSMSNAQACDRFGGCTDASGHQYPYNACDGLGPCYRDRAWSDVAHSRLHSSFDLQDAVQTMHIGVTRDTDGSGLCGIASFPSSSNYFGTNSGPTPSGDSMATDATTSCRNYVPSHEMGHVFNAIHEKGNCNVGGRPGVMLYDSNRGNFFCDANRREVQRCNDDFLSCPRDGTG